jgi:hypothetical protein
MTNQQLNPTLNPSPNPSTEVRLYKHRASYNLDAARQIFRDSPIAHVAFVQPRSVDGRVGETLMNIPLILVIMREDAREDDDDINDDEEGGGDELEGLAVYLHT